MDFFDQQDVARKRTRRLVVLFVLAVAALVAAVYVTVVVVGAFWGLEPGRNAAGDSTWWRTELFLAVAVATLGVIGTGSAFKVAQLAHGGGEGVARLLGGRPLDPATSEARERRLLNIVEEMALAAGTPVPTVYLLEREGAINAFAAGFTRDEAVIGVTRGCLEHLSRDELQGVVAHELSHVLNGDMRLNLRLIGLLHGILVIALMGYWILRSGFHGSGSRRGRGGGPVLALGLALLVIGWIGVFFGRLIKAAVSRQREILADAAAVQFTRNPSGLAGALKKIGASSGRAKLVSSQAEQASHLLFAEGVGSWLGWTSTHPPLERRIRQLDPHWDGTFPQLPPVEAPVAPPPATAPTPPRPAAPPLPALLPEALAAAVGSPSPEQVAFSAALLADLPAPLDERMRQPASARAVVAGLLIDHLAGVRSHQLGLVDEAGDAALAAEVRQVLPLLAGLPREARLPLLDLCLPALRRLSASQYETFRALVERLAHADDEISLFEYALERALVRHLDPVFGRRRAARVDVYSLRRLGKECSLLLSAVARAGHADDDEATRAVEAAGRALGPEAPDVVLMPAELTTVERLDQALGELARVAPPRKRQLLTALATAVSWDGKATAEEVEIVRAVADALDCPLPPLAPGGATPRQQATA